MEEGKELGAGVAVTLDGRLVVDLRGGYVDHQRTRSWQKNTLVNVYSTTKGMTAACVHRLVDQSVLDLDRKISHYWPEFGCNSKEEICFGLGFMMPVPGATMGPNVKAFGHPGMGGSLGFADPEARIGFGYVMNLSGPPILINERPSALVAALYDCLGYREGQK